MNNVVDLTEAIIRRETDRKILFYEPITQTFFNGRMYEVTKVDDHNKKNLIIDIPLKF